MSHNGDSTPSNSGPGHVLRYVDINGVEIDPSKVPSSFRHLIPMAARWCIGDDAGRLELMRRTSSGVLVELIQAVAPHDEDIWNWCASHRDSIPVPDEVVIFDGLLQAAAEAKQIVPQADLPNTS